MSIKPKPFVPVKKQIMENTCKCIDPNSVVCLAGRHQTSLELSELMGGCSCPCHFSCSGIEIAHSLWRPIVLLSSIQQAARNGWKRGPSEVK